MERDNESPAEKLAKTKAKRPYVLKRGAPVVRCHVGRARQSLGLSRLAVTKANGLCVSALIEIEAGNGASIATALKLARFFGKPVEELWEPLEEEKGE